MEVLSKAWDDGCCLKNPPIPPLGKGGNVATFPLFVKGARGILNTGLTGAPSHDTSVSANGYEGPPSPIGTNGHAVF